MSDIDDFMRNRKPTGKSKLDVYTNDILTLKKYGYSNADVLLYLSEKKKQGSLKTEKWVFRLPCLLV